MESLICRFFKYPKDTLFYKYIFITWSDKMQRTNNYNNLDKKTTMNMKSVEIMRREKFATNLLGYYQDP